MQQCGLESHVPPLSFFFLYLDAGEVFAWGDGQHGQLGHGVQRTRYSPLAVAALRGKYVTHIAAGELHSAAISGALTKEEANALTTPTRGLTALVSPAKTKKKKTASGDLYVWGAGQSGRLGLANAPARVLAPTPVAGAPWQGHKVVHVACGFDFTIGMPRILAPYPPRATSLTSPLHRGRAGPAAAVIDDGRVFSTGGNATGQLGVGDTSDRSEFTLVDGLTGQDIRRVACGSGHAAAVSGASSPIIRPRESGPGALTYASRHWCALPPHRVGADLHVGRWNTGPARARGRAAASGAGAQAGRGAARPRGQRRELRDSSHRCHSW